MSAFTSLLKMESPRAPGPAPSYGQSHVLLALLTIGDTGGIGRHALAEEAGLGEGAVRTVIKWLKEDGYIAVESKGCQLTTKGNGAYLELRKRMPKMMEMHGTDP